jgi:hypothetical protein
MNPIALIFEIYLDQATDRGKKLFAYLLACINSGPLVDGMKISDNPETTIFYHPLLQGWFLQKSGEKAQDMFAFLQEQFAYSYEEAIGFIYYRICCVSPFLSSNLPNALVSKDDFKIRAIDLVRVKTKEQISHATTEEFQNFSDLERSITSTATQQTNSPEQTPLELENDNLEAFLHRYFKPAKKKQGQFFTTSEIVHYLNVQVQNLWRFSKEETGKILNREGFALCKGKRNGVSGYFLHVVIS